VWTVSEGFKQKAKQLGRHIQCKIHVGDMVFYDNSIIEFTFNDIAHENSLSIGCVNPNRFHTILICEDDIPIDSVVRPYISYDEEIENAEWCPLGVFYITNRYRKRNTIYLTCYDKMKLLEEEFLVQTALPAKVQDIFNEVCDFYSIENDFESKSYVVGYLPHGIKASEIISFCVGINGYSAKFDREGKLIIKDFSVESEILTRNNYIDISQNPGKYTIHEVMFDANSKEIKAGEGGKLSRLFSKNDFASQQSANTILKKYKGFSYLSGEIKFKGIPYYEAGEMIYVQDRYSDEILPFVISEIEYTYKGGLNAVLFSKKLYEEESFVLFSDFNMSLETLYNELVMKQIKKTNDEDISLSTIEKSLAQLSVRAFKDTFVCINAVVNIYSDEDVQLSLAVKVNDMRKPLVGHYNIQAGTQSTVCFYHLEEYLYSGVNDIEIMGVCESESALIYKDGMEITLTGQFLEGLTGMGKPQAQGFVEIDKIQLNQYGVEPLLLKCTKNISSCTNENAFNTIYSNIIIEGEGNLIKNLGYQVDSIIE